MRSPFLWSLDPDFVDNIEHAMGNCTNWSLVPVFVWVGYHRVLVSLADRACLPCTGDTPRLGEPEIAVMLSQVEGWKIDDRGHLRKSYGFKNYVTAVDFVNAITRVAEEAGHHPDLTVRWGDVGVELWTHAIEGLSQNDFVLAARIDRI